MIFIEKNNVELFKNNKKTFQSILDIDLNGNIKMKYLIKNGVIEFDNINEFILFIQDSLELLSSSYKIDYIQYQKLKMKGE